MLDVNTSPYVHALQNLSLIALSIIFLPLDTFLSIIALSSNLLRTHSAIDRRNAATKRQGLKQKNVLVTGVGMTKGLTLARLFYKSGHNVIGADFSPTACGRASRALAKFYTLRQSNSKLGSGTYVQDLLDIVSREKIDIWVSCSGVVSATEDGEAKEIIESRTACKAIQFDVETTQLLHEKHTFIEHTKQMGLAVPDTHIISNSAAAETILASTNGKHYIMKPIGVDDANRGDMTLLPKSTRNETRAHLAKLNISVDSPWILQQFINGSEYCTHALVVNGTMKAFVACPSSELLMHYCALPAKSRLSQKMLEFTSTFAARQGCDFTGHLSFDFLIERSQEHHNSNASRDLDLVIYPIECNPRAHTAVVLFNEHPGLVDAYLALLEPSTSGSLDITAKDNIRTVIMPVTPQRDDKYYWIGHDLVTLLLRPLALLLTLHSKEGLSELSRDSAILLQHILFWRDGTFERWDPLPWWWLYHIYWPMQFWNAFLTGTKWSRINVSTTKMFRC